MTNKDLYEAACYMAQFKGYDSYKEYYSAVEQIYKDLLERRNKNFTFL